jgi:integrase
MAKKTPFLTVKTIEAFDKKPPATRVEVSDGGTRLYLIRQPSGAMSWAFRYRAPAGNKPKKLTLGTYPIIDLVGARTLAREAAEAVGRGKDPAGEKKAARHPDEDVATIDELVKQFVIRHALKNTRPRSHKETMRILGVEIDPDSAGEKKVRLRHTKSGGYVLSAWRGRRIESIKRADVRALVEGISECHPVMGNRVYSAIRRLFSWALEKELIETTPCGGMKRPSPEITRERVLDDIELQAVLRASRKLSQPWAGFIMMLTLTMQRRSEVAGMRWSELNLAECIWTIPGGPDGRTKNRRTHVVPLSEAAMAVLQAVPRIGNSDFVFSYSGAVAVNNFSKIKSDLDAFVAAELGAPAASWCLHDLRRTGTSTMARLGIDLPPIEKVLNHQSGSFGGVAGIYQRFNFADKKRDALEAWSVFLDRLDRGGHPDNVVQLSEVRAKQ